MLLPLLLQLLPQLHLCFLRAGGDDGGVGGVYGVV